MAMAAASSEEEQEDEAFLACLASPCELHCSSSHWGRGISQAHFASPSFRSVSWRTQEKIPFFSLMCFLPCRGYGIRNWLLSKARKARSLGRLLSSAWYGGLMSDRADAQGCCACSFTAQSLSFLPREEFRFHFLFSSMFCVLHSLLEGDFMDFVVHSQHFHSHFPVAPASSRVGWAALLLLLVGLCLCETLIRSETCKSARNLQIVRRVLPFSILEGTELLGASFGLWEQRKPAPVCLPEAPFRAQCKRTSFSSAHVGKLSLNSLSLSFVSFSQRVGISSSRRCAILILHRVLCATNPRSLMRFPRRIASKQSSSSCFLSVRKGTAGCEEMNVVESSEHKEFHSLRRRK